MQGPQHHASSSATSVCSSAGLERSIRFNGLVSLGMVDCCRVKSCNHHHMTCPCVNNMVLPGKAWSHYTRLAPTLSTWQGCLGVLIIVFDVTALPVGSTLNAWSWSRGMGVVG